MLMSMAVSGLGTRRRRRDERRRETRLLLLQAAALLFARHGYHEVSLDAVADQAGFTKGAVYSHFSSKQDLLANLLEFYCEQQHSQIRSTDGARLALRAMLRAAARSSGEEGLS